MQKKHKKLQQISEENEEAKDEELFQNITTTEDLQRYDYRLTHKAFIITEIGEMKLASGESVGNRKYKQIYDQNMTKEKAKERLGIAYSDSLNSSSFLMLGKEQSSSFSIMNTQSNTVTHETSLMVQKIKKKEKKAQRKKQSANMNKAYTQMPQPYLY